MTILLTQGQQINEQSQLIEVSITEGEWHFCGLVEWIFPIPCVETNSPCGSQMLSVLFVYFH